MSTLAFELVLALMALALGAALYVFAFSQAGPVGRSILTLGVPAAGRRLVPALQALAELLPPAGGRHEMARRPAEPAAAAIGVAHVGATETSVLLAHTEAFRPDPPVLHERPRLDPEAQAIIAAFDDHVRDWRTAPDYVLKWQTRVDEVCEEVGMSHEAHRRWRSGAWDWRTGSYPVLDREPVAAHCSTWS